MSLTRTTRLLQLAAGVGLAFALVLALRRPVRAESNVGATTIWLLWWPVVPFLALAAGRLWCAVCPFAALSDLADRAADALAPWLPWRHGPGRRVRRASALWLPISIALLGVAFLALGLEMSGPLTAAVIGVFVAGSVGLTLAVRGRVWCRYACPLGASLGLYASLGAWTLAPAPAGAAPGGHGALATAGEGASTSASGWRPKPFRCPALLSPQRAIDPRHCQACLRCLDAKAAVVVHQRPAVPVLAPAEAALAVSLAGVLVADTVRMTPLFLGYIDAALAVVGPERYRLAVALLPVLSIAVVAAVVALIGIVALPRRRANGLAGGLPSGLAGRLGRWREAAGALVPLALAAQLSLSLQHLVGSAWPSLQGLAIELLPVPWDGHIPPSNAYSVLLPLKAVQLLLLALAAGVIFRQQAGGGTSPSVRGTSAGGALQFVRSANGASGLRSVAGFLVQPAGVTTAAAAIAFAAMFALPMTLSC